jgi:hypothetical protein
MGTFGRLVAGLLALALLVLPAAPLRHAAAAPVGHQAAAHCLVHDDTASDGQTATADVHLHHLHAQPQAEDQGQPCGPADGKAGPACCVSAQCPATVAAPPLAAADLLPSPGPMIRLVFQARRPLGTDVAPALPPPRKAA